MRTPLRNWSWVAACLINAKCKWGSIFALTTFLLAEPTNQKGKGLKLRSLMLTYQVMTFKLCDNSWSPSLEQSTNTGVLDVAESSSMIMSCLLLPDSGPLVQFSSKTGIFCYQPNDGKGCHGSSLMTVVILGSWRHVGWGVVVVLADRALVWNLLGLFSRH